MDKITRDISLRGENWECLISQLYHTVFSTLYEMYVLCTSIGIMYDQQLVMEAGKAVEEAGSVPRTVQLNNKEELEILFQTAVLTSDLVEFDEDTRLELAFGEGKKIEGFDDMHFLTAFANYGAKILAEKLGDDVLESMENIKDLLLKTISGLNFEINPLDIDTLNISVEDLLDD